MNKVALCNSESKHIPAVTSVAEMLCITALLGAGYLLNIIDICFCEDMEQKKHPPFLNKYRIFSVCLVKHHSIILNLSTHLGLMVSFTA
jgi:hypothetical protein